LVGVLLPKEKIERSEAILRKRRNTRKGLQIRNKILIFLDKKPDKSFTISAISDAVGVSYSSIRYHLKNLAAENIVDKKGLRIFEWQITGLGQQTIKKWLEEQL